MINMTGLINIISKDIFNLLKLMIWDFSKALQSVSPLSSYICNQISKIPIIKNNSKSSSSMFTHRVNYNPFLNISANFSRNLSSQDILPIVTQRSIIFVLEMKYIGAEMKAEVVSFQAWWARWYNLLCRSNVMQASHNFICSITGDSGELVDK